MTKTEASTVLALLAHLTGAQELDEAALLGELEALHAAAARVVPALPLDTESLLWVLAVVAQRHADAGWYDDADYDDPDPDEDARPVDDVRTGAL